MEYIDILLDLAHRLNIEYTILVDVASNDPIAREAERELHILSRVIRLPNPRINRVYVNNLNTLIDRIKDVTTHAVAQRIVSMNRRSRSRLGLRKKKVKSAARKTHANKK